MQLSLTIRINELYLSQNFDGVELNYTNIDKKFRVSFGNINNNKISISE